MAPKRGAKTKCQGAAAKAKAKAKAKAGHTAAATSVAVVPHGDAAWGISPPRGRRTTNAEVAVDAAVHRAIRDHFQCYDLSVLKDVEIEGERLFAWVRKHWMESRSRNKNLTVSWWATLQSRISGALDWTDLQVPPGNTEEVDRLMQAAFEQLECCSLRRNCQCDTPRGMCDACARWV